MPISFDVMYHSQIRKNPALKCEGKLMALDPGETTGVAIFIDGVLKEQLQIKTWPIELAVMSFSQILDQHQPDKVVYEMYLVYEWKAEDHTWSQVPTVQIIGSLRTLLYLRKIPNFSQTAQVAKQFVTDDRLKDWGFWIKGLKHSRDAIRHGCYFLLFGPSKT